jgi:hypothetical protein
MRLVQHSSLGGSPAPSLFGGPWLCVPPSRAVCLCTQWLLASTVSTAATFGLRASGRIYYGTGIRSINGSSRRRLWTAGHVSLRIASGFEPAAAAAPGAGHLMGLASERREHLAAATAGGAYVAALLGCLRAHERDSLLAGAGSDNRVCQLATRPVTAKTATAMATEPPYRRRTAAGTSRSR